MPTKHLPTPAAIQADDVIRVERIVELALQCQFDDPFNAITSSAWIAAGVGRCFVGISPPTVSASTR